MAMFRDQQKEKLLRAGGGGNTRECEDENELSSLPRRKTYVYRAVTY